jgi:Fe-S cluster assembly iron-binding protein IscA
MGGNEMLQLTDKAAVYLKSALSELHPDEDACFRLGLTPEGVKLVVDQERPGDSTVKYGDEVLIVIDSESAGRFEGHTMDINEATRQLVFT